MRLISYICNVLAGLIYTLYRSINLGLKKLHLLILRSYLGPFVLTFFIVMFILLMQFIWKYIDDFMGKGLEYAIIAELLVYASANLVTLALPLAILLSSIMTFGNLAENYELVAMKSTGLSLMKIMQPLTIFILLTAVGAFYFSNNMSPIANLKFRSLLWDVTKAKPSLELSEGVFYNGVDNYSIRVSRKEKDSNILHDLLIYHHDPQTPGNRRVIRSKTGTMEKSPNGQHLVLNLYNGVSYNEEGTMRGRNQDNSLPHIKSSFKRDEIRIDLSGFQLERTDEDQWKNHMQMLTIGQLSTIIDSLKIEKKKRYDGFNNYMTRNLSIKSDSSNLYNSAVATSNYFDSTSVADQKRVLNVAINMTRNARNYMERTNMEMKGRSDYILRFLNEWHRKLTLSFACIVLFFIGAPLGAIIKKGGLGLPVVISVLFFLVFHITSISGEKMVISGILSPLAGMWMSTVILFPVALFLTYKAAKDAALFDRDTYNKYFSRIYSLFSKNRNSI